MLCCHREIWRQLLVSPFDAIHERIVMIYKQSYIMFNDHACYVLCVPIPFLCHPVPPMLVSTIIYPCRHIAEGTSTGPYKMLNQR